MRPLPQPVKAALASLSTLPASLFIPPLPAEYQQVLQILSEADSARAAHPEIAGARQELPHMKAALERSRADVYHTLQARRGWGGGRAGLGGRGRCLGRCQLAMAGVHAMPLPTRGCSLHEKPCSFSPLLCAYPGLPSQQVGEAPAKLQRIQQQRAAQRERFNAEFEKVGAVCSPGGVGLA